MANIIEDEVVKAEIQDGLSQVDTNLIISNFVTAFDVESRQLRVHVTAVNKESNERITIDNVLR